MFFAIIIINLFVAIFGAKLPNFGKNSPDEMDPQYWANLAKTDLFEALHRRENYNKAKNVILFLGDGMGISTITTSRILKGQLRNNSGEETQLAFEDFPNTCLIKNYNVDYQVPDSAGTATAYLCGAKTNKGVIGVSAKVPRYSQCETVRKNTIESIFDKAIEAGMSTGVVTTTRITHATPAGAYASIGDRDWEGNIPQEKARHPSQADCQDIGRQLVENEPGTKLNVIMGGGGRYLFPKSYIDPVSGKTGEREDGLNLADKWLEKKKLQGLSSKKYQYVKNRDEFLAANKNKDLDYLFGIFNHNHMSYEWERNPKQEPSIEEMTEAAINILSKNDKGYLLLVEGGRIDLAHHDNYANLALYETVSFDQAIEKALKIVNVEETLVVVTADHSHAFTMNGYPLRGNNIMGIADNDEETGKPFTTLMYANGPGYIRDRPDPSTLDTSNPRYQNLAAVWMEESNHGGEDVALYSIGPMSHLFRGTKEQSYVAHVMQFASCIGSYTNSDHCLNRNNSSPCSFMVNNSLIHLFVFLNFIHILIKLRLFC